MSHFARSLGVSERRAFIFEHSYSSEEHLSITRMRKRVLSEKKKANNVQA